MGNLMNDNIFRKSEKNIYHYTKPDKHLQISKTKENIAFLIVLVGTVYFKTS